MTTYKQYLLALMFFSSIFLLGVGLVNFTIDPEQIYHDPVSTFVSPSAFAAQLLESKNGLMITAGSLNERDKKSSLARKNSNVDCAIIGSSHVLQISSFRKNASLTGFCNSMINLGVSGGTLEDYLALSHYLLKNKQKVKTIIFGIDPWSLDFNRDPRWERYKDSYYSMKRKIRKVDIASSYDNFSGWKYLSNLINPSYFWFFRKVSAFEMQVTPNFSGLRAISNQ